MVFQNKNYIMDSHIKYFTTLLAWKGPSSSLFGIIHNMVIAAELGLSFAIRHGSISEIDMKLHITITITAA